MRDDFLLNRNSSGLPDQVSGFYVGGKRVMRYDKNKNSVKTAFGFTKSRGTLHDLYDLTEYLNDDPGDEQYNNE